MDQIEEIRRKVDIVELISETVSLKKAGRNWRGLCPFHDEKTPSFMVSPERQMFKCFGCGIGGDCFKFVMERERLEFGEALRLLADRAGVLLKEFRPGPDQIMREKLAEINHLTSEYYHYLLTDHPVGQAAREYLLKRGVTSASIKTFKLGFSPNEWEGLRRFLGKKKYSDELIERAGLIIRGQRGWYDRFRNRIMFPLFDYRNRVVGFSGRVFETESREAKYVNSPETQLFHKSEILYGLTITKTAIKKADKVVVVEGEFDLIISFQAGVKNVVAIKGSALTNDQLDLLKRFCGHLVLALDTDAAGDAASRRGIELAEAKGLNIRVIQLAYGKDPDECARHSSQLWKKSVKTAVPIYDFYIESAKTRFGVDTPEGKRQISDELAPILGKITNQVVKAHYIKKLAGVLGVDEAAVSAEIDKQSRQGLVPPASPARPVMNRSRRELVEEYSLALTLAHEDHLAEVVGQVEIGWFAPGARQQVMIRLKDWFAKRKTWKINRFIATLPAELVGVVDSAFLTDLKQLGTDREALERETVKTFKMLKTLAAKDDLARLAVAIKEAETKQDKTRRQRLEAELVEKVKFLGYNHD
jgi:DNA primase